MPPFSISSATIAQLFPSNSSSVSEGLRKQWTNPSAILELLLLVGGDVIQSALAQLSGHPILPTPVVFSFGWVSYSFMALISAIGDHRLMPKPDLPAILISTEKGYSRSNQSWILGRILRDFEEESWGERKIYDELDKLKGSKPKKGLCISIYEARPGAGNPKPDFVWYAGYLVAIFQLGLACGPLKWGEWQVVLVTFCGTALAFLTGSLPQWRKERWEFCRKKSKKTFILTRGNGAQHALVIQGNEESLDLEDLAGMAEGEATPVWMRLLSGFMVVLWVILLITVGGMEEHSWFLLGVGALGMIYTSYAAGCPRKPENLGIPLGYKDHILDGKVMVALQKVELKYTGVGLAMLNTFFPGKRTPEEEEFWKKAELLYESTKPPYEETPKAIDERNERMSQLIERLREQGLQQDPSISIPSRNGQLDQQELTAQPENGRLLSNTTSDSGSTRELVLNRD